MIRQEFDLPDAFFPDVQVLMASTAKSSVEWARRSCQNDSIFVVVASFF
jgi:hypothetical protein